jgi:hypothetical protein
MRSALDMARGFCVRRRASAAGVALLLVAVQSAGSGHLLLSPHVVCPEHGELVHADAAGAIHAHGVAGAESSIGEGPAISAVHAEAAAEHGDEHCAVLGSRREHAIVPAPYQGLHAAASSDAMVVPAAASARHEARARYDVAPKQSPPV